MYKIKSFLAIAAIVMGAWPVLAQEKRVSPHETISTVINDNRVTIVYGRPYTKAPQTGEMRKIWGGLVPYGKVYRLGADEASLLITEQPIKFGNTTVPAGAYTLFMWPQENGATKLIINKQIGQWGETYDEKKDLARIEKETLETKADQLTLDIAENPSGGGVLKIMWEDTQFSAPFTVSK
jgi:hypothetical protein